MAKALLSSTQGDRQRHKTCRQTSSSEVLIERVYWPWFLDISQTKSPNTNSGTRAQRMKSQYANPAYRSAAASRAF
jgi:hypothetical protein